MMLIPSLEELLDGSGPHNELGEPCPWPYDPLLMTGQPIGMYHCPYCGAMVVAGMAHPDYPDEEDIPSCSNCGNGPLTTGPELLLGLCQDCM